MKARLAALGAVAAVAARVAPTVAEPARTLRLEADAVVPFAEWDRVAGGGAGGGLALAVTLAPDLEVTGRIAVVLHRQVVDGPVATRLLEAPIVGGARYTAARLGRVAGFVFGEVGMVATRTSVQIGDLADHDSELGFAAAIGGGIRLDRVDLRIAAWLADLGDLDRGVGATAAVAVDVLRW